jgi:3-hydroxy-9,10-secoandrosta-1,3,5(10)-triene-9,17-dione monooxygenase reductase component
MDTTGTLATTYRRAISQFSTGVAVITTKTDEGLVGMTASAVSSLSMEPLQLIVCIGNTLATRAAIVDSGRFAVNVLGRGQDHLAKQFASRRPDKFAGVGLSSDHDVPVLSDAIAHFVCSVGGTLPGGDHTIVVGDVLSCGYVRDADPLVYFGSVFAGLCSPQEHAQHSYDWQLSLVM